MPKRKQADGCDMDGDQTTPADPVVSVAPVKVGIAAFNLTESATRVAMFPSL